MHDMFSGRSKDYVKFRADYSKSLKSFLSNDLAIGEDIVVADVGSGTGLLTQILADLGARVFAVEPNDEMRKESELKLATYKNFISVAGSAENTNLDDCSVDLITAGNAFHWFDHEKARTEFKRILISSGKFLIIRTDWKEVPALRMKEYDRIICKYCVGREGLVSDPVLEKKVIHDFFTSYKVKNLGTSRVKYNLEQLHGRFLSTSFSPQFGHDKFESAMKELKDIFEKFKKNEQFFFDVMTTVVYGSI